MKAAILKQYSKTDVDLFVEEIPQPQIGPQEVLIQVKAAGVNPLDNMIRHGQVKLITPYSLPLIMGNELAGQVVAVGSQVDRFQKGDRVFGRLPLDKIGAFAEYAAVDQQALALIPDYLDFAEAAAIPLTALTAMQAFDLMKVEAGKTIFISGGTGGLGAMAIPLAKSKGLTVITNGSGSNEERVKTLGASRFIDYKKEDYSQILSDVDYILDTLGGKELDKQFRILKKGGSLVSLKGVPNKAFAERQGLSFVKKFLFGLVGSKYDKLARQKEASYHFVFVESNGQQLQEVADLLEDLQLKPAIDSLYSFEEINQALDKIAHQPSKGKTIVTF